MVDVEDMSEQSLRDYMKRKYSSNDKEIRFDAYLNETHNILVLNKEEFCSPKDWDNITEIFDSRDMTIYRAYGEGLEAIYVKFKNEV